MDEIQRRVSRYQAKFRSVTTVGEGRALVLEILADVVRLIVQRAKTKPAPVGVNEAFGRGKGDDDYFWLSGTALYMYAVFALALLTHRLWILNGISVIVLGKVLAVVVKWSTFILDDDELRFAIKYIRGWLRLLLQEGEEILSGKAAWKLATAYGLLSNAPTGVSYLRYFVRYKMTGLRLEFMSEIGANRFEKRQPGYLQQRVSAAIRSRRDRIGGSKSFSIRKYRTDDEDA